MKIGVIPCSIYPPNTKQLKTEIAKFKRFDQDAGALFALTSTSFCKHMKAASVLYRTPVKWLAIIAELSG